MNPTNIIVRCTYQNATLLQVHSSFVIWYASHFDKQNANIEATSLTLLFPFRGT